MHNQFMPRLIVAPALQWVHVLALLKSPRYSAAVAVNPAAGFGDPISKRRTGARKIITGAFFVPAMSLYGGRAWETFGSAGFLLPRFANLRTAATLDRLATICGSSYLAKGAPPMEHLHALNPFNTTRRIQALKARAIAALRADSSLSVRLARYQSAMAKARALEAAGGAQ